MDGTGFCNVDRSDCCLGWSIIPYISVKSAKVKNVTATTPTHEIIYEDINITLSNGEVLRYRQPFMSPIVDAVDIMEPLCRTATPLDAEVLTKKSSSSEGGGARSFFSLR